MDKQIYILLIVFLAFGCKKDEGTHPFEDEIRLFETVQYKAVENTDENLLSLDIYYTDNTTHKKPIVIWVHGGGWCIGDKTNKIDNKVNLFQSENWLFVSVNYRLSPFPYEVSNSNRIKYPDHNNDVADAIKWIYENIDKYGGNKNKIVLLGHSAGAHLVALTGTDNQFIEDRGIPFSAIKGVAAIDTEGYNVREKVTQEVELYLNAFDTQLTENIKASPLYNVDNPNCPTFFIAKRGLTNRIAAADEFIEALESAQVSVSQVNGSIYSHSEINDAIGKPEELTITPPLISFIKACFE